MYSMNTMKKKRDNEIIFHLGQPALLPTTKAVNSINKHTTSILSAVKEDETRADEGLLLKEKKPDQLLR